MRITSLHTKLTGLILCSLLFYLSGCNAKYEEGPTISFRSAKERVAGEWVWAIARETNRGMVTNWSLRFQGDTLRILDNGEISETTFGLTGTWALVSKKNELNILFGQKSDSLKIPASIAFDIRLLKEKEMWLEFQDDSLKIEWQLSSLN